MLALAFTALLTLAQPRPGTLNVPWVTANAASRTANVARAKVDVAPSDDATADPKGPAGLPLRAGAILIRNSGSTNTSGYAIEVSPDGATLVAQNGTAVPKTLSADATRKLFDDVRASMPLAAGPARPCMRSVSFGSSTTVSYENATTSDLSCRGDAASAQLRSTIAAVLAELGVSTLPRQRIQE